METETLSIGGDLVCRSYQSTNVTSITAGGDVNIGTYVVNAYTEYGSALYDDVALLKQNVNKVLEMQRVVEEMNRTMTLLAKKGGSENHCCCQRQKHQEGQENASRADVLPTEAENEEIHEVSVTLLTDSSELPALVQSSEVANSGLSGEVASDSCYFDLDEIVQHLDLLDMAIPSSEQQFEDNFVATHSSPVNSPGLIPPDSSNHVQDQLMTHAPNIDDFDDLLISNQNVLPVPEESRYDEPFLAGNITGNNGAHSVMIPENANQAQELVQSDSSQLVIVRKDDHGPVLQPHGCCIAGPSNHENFFQNNKQRRETYGKSGMAIAKKCLELHQKTGCRIFLRAEYLTQSNKLFTYQFGELPNSWGDDLHGTGKRKRPASGQWTSTSYSESHQFHVGAAQQGIGFPRHTSATWTSASTSASISASALASPSSTFYPLQPENVPPIDCRDPNMSHLDITMDTT